MTLQMPDQVRDVFDSYPDEQRRPLLEIRELIFGVADETDGVGPLVEALRWGQPSYLTEASRSGTAVRLDRFGASDIAVLVHCQTTLIESSRKLFPELDYEKNRAIILSPSRPVPADELRLFVELALTYKLPRRRR